MAYIGEYPPGASEKRQTLHFTPCQVILSPESWNFLPMECGILLKDSEIP